MVLPITSEKAFSACPVAPTQITISHQKVQCNAESSVKHSVHIATTFLPSLKGSYIIIPFNLRLKLRKIFTTNCNLGSAKRKIKTEEYFNSLSLLFAIRMHHGPQGVTLSALMSLSYQIPLRCMQKQQSAEHPTWQVLILFMPSTDQQSKNKQGTFIKKPRGKKKAKSNYDGPVLTTLP